jgi:iron(III) transport system substrate-binding protein
MHDEPQPRRAPVTRPANPRAARLLLAASLLLAACGAPAAGPASAPSGASSPPGAAKPSGAVARPGDAAAQPARKPTTVAELAMYRGADRQQLLLEGAQREGKLVYYTTLTWLETLAREFEKKYPFVTVEFYRADAKDLTERVINEYKAGRFATDVMNTTDATLLVLHEEGILQEFWLPDLTAYPTEVQKAGTQGGVVYLGSGANHISLGFNTTLVSPAEAPRTLDDLLDPRWKGRMTLTANNTGANWVGMALETKGRDYVQRFGTQDVKLQSMSGAALAQLVVSGEVPLSPVIFDNNIAVAKEKGAPVEWRPLEPVIVNVQSAALASRAPNPHTALLFLDFVHSREGQELVRKGGVDATRLDMLPPDKTFQKVNMYSKYPLDEYERRFTEWERVLKQLQGR